MFHATTVLAVRHRDQTVMASDGQVTFGDTVVKQTARKIRKLYNDRVLAGFAGSAADSFALFSRFEAKLEQHRGNLERSVVELVKDWRTDRILRRLEAMLVVMDVKSTYLLSGQRRSDRARRRDHRDRIGRRLCAGRGQGAGAAHRRSTRGRSPARRWRSPARICIYSNDKITIEELTCRRERMAIYLPETTTTTAESLTPRQIVAELDKYVIGQAQAKRAVAIALRNRTRRQKLPADLAEEIAPKNILMIGPTGVGKTEIARRLARLAQSPFLKVEASKFTEVGYVGRDVESMVRDLVELGVEMVREERRAEVREKARRPPRSACSICCCRRCPPPPSTTPTPPRIREQAQRTREKLREQLRDGRLDHKHVEIDVREKSFPSFEIIAGSSVEEVDINVKDMLPGLFQGRSKKRKLRVPEALEALAQEEEQKLIDMDTVARAAVERVQQSGIIFVDEIDKVAGREGGHGPDVSREGVQRDILPIIEGHDRQHQVRDGADRPHPVHRRRRLPRLEAVRPDSRAAGPLPDPRRARGARPRGLRPHPDRAEERAGQAVHRAALDRRRRALVHARRDRADRRLRHAWSTSAPRTSARGGCTRSWRSCSTRSRSTRPT